MMSTALVVEDHPLYRNALARLLRTIMDGAEVLPAGSAEEALFRPLKPRGVRLILSDMRLPGLCGAEAIQALRDRYHSAALLVISASDDRRDVVAAFRAGARAFISKSVPNEVLTEVLGDMARRARTSRFGAPEWITRDGTREMSAETMPELTSRQRQILVLLCRGYANKEIGLRIGLAEVTVKQHVSSIMHSLNAANRTQAVLAARRLGLHMPHGSDESPEPGSW